MFRVIDKDTDDQRKGQLRCIIGKVSKRTTPISWGRDRRDQERPDEKQGV